MARWSHTHLYPQIKAGPAFDDIYVQIMQRSDGRRWGMTRWRMGRGEMIPEMAQDSTVGEMLESLSTRSGVPEEAWRHLGRLFLDALNPPGDDTGR